jgi:hypothetical protein
VRPEPKARSLSLAVLIQSAFPYMQLQSALDSKSGQSGLTLIKTKKISVNPLCPLRLLGLWTSDSYR